MIFSRVLPSDGPSAIRVVIVFVLLYVGVTAIFALNRHLKRPPQDNQRP